jgi:hypothetical protein
LKDRYIYLDDAVFGALQARHPLGVGLRPRRDIDRQVSSFPPDLRDLHITWLPCRPI